MKRVALLSAFLVGLLVGGGLVAAFVAHLVVEHDTDERVRAEFRRSAPGAYVLDVWTVPGGKGGAPDCEVGYGTALTASAASGRSSRVLSLLLHVKHRLERPRADDSREPCCAPRLASLTCGAYGFVPRETRVARLAGLRSLTLAETSSSPLALSVHQETRSARFLVD